MIITTEDGRAAIMNYPLPIIQYIGIYVFPDRVFVGTHIDTILLSPRNECIARLSLYNLNNGCLSIKALFDPASTVDGQLCFNLTRKGD